MKKFLLLLTLLCAGFAAPSFAQSLCTEITTLPYTVSAPGNYCLVANETVNVTSGNSINIAANDVVLDCQNFSITNTSTSNAGSSNAINVASRNTATIKNCRILGGFTTGIRVSQNNAVANSAFYITIRDNYIAGPFLHGIYASGSGIEITNNRVYDVGNQQGSFAMGIRLGATTLSGHPAFHIVRGNLVAGTNNAVNNSYGIYSDKSVGGIFLENAVSGTRTTKAGYRSYGIKVLGQYNRVSDNHIVGSGLDNDTGIESADGTTSCFDNYLRDAVPTNICDATMGNF